jgi:hydroxymethylpyrimidine/phosphomethylpyrimidine kinase
MKTPSVVLTIAGSDSSGGAGIQADIKAISALGSYAASVITSVTAQNTLGVQGIHPIPTDMVRQQIESVMDDLHPDAIKIGMVCDKDIALTIAACIRKYQPKWVVYDPVMVSTSGHKLMTDDTLEAIKRELIPLASLITPNLHEANILSGLELKRKDEMEKCAGVLGKTLRCSVLVKGGHLEDGEMCDVFYDAREQRCFHYRAPKIESHNLHGTGCTLSSAIATKLSQGHSMKEAIALAKDYVTKAIDAAKDMKIGHGYGPLWHF